MGCDIHMYLEMRNWTYDGEREYYAWVQVMGESVTYGVRNYALFGILAGVRRDMPLIAAPRGLPGDVSPETRIESERIGLDGHSRSWLTFEEILKFDWTQPTGHNDGSTCQEVAAEFLAWIQSLRSGPTRLTHKDPSGLRLVFWFDN